LAARADDRRLVIFTPWWRPLERSLSFTTMASDSAHQHLAELPENHAARSDFVREYSIGSRWTVTTGSRSLDVVANKAGAVYGACEDRMRSVLVADVNPSSTAGESGTYSLATPAEKGPHTLPTSVARTTALTDAQKSELEILVRRQLRVTMPTMFAPKSSLWGFEVNKTDFDRRIERGEGQTIINVRTFRPAPDGVDRLYVRAHWLFDGEPGAGINLWIRFDGRSFAVEQTDATAMRSTRVLARYYPDPQRPRYPTSTGSDLSVLPAPDGWAYLIRTIEGYEYVRVQLLKYSANGPTGAVILFDYGC